jgi:hypothetical protein
MALNANVCFWAPWLQIMYSQLLSSKIVKRAYVQCYPTIKILFQRHAMAQQHAKGAKKDCRYQLKFRTPGQTSTK